MVNFWKISFNKIKLLNEKQKIKKKLKKKNTFTILSRIDQSGWKEKFPLLFVCHVWLIS